LELQKEHENNQKLLEEESKFRSVQYQQVLGVPIGQLKSLRTAYDNRSMELIIFLKYNFMMEVRHHLDQAYQDLLNLRQSLDKKNKDNFVELEKLQAELKEQKRKTEEITRQYLLKRKELSGKQIGDNGHSKPPLQAYGETLVKQPEKKRRINLQIQEQIKL